MNLFGEAIAWLSDPAHQMGEDGIWNRLGEHLAYSLAATGAACIIGIPLGYLVGHTHKGRSLVVVSTGAARALPTLGVVTLFGLWLGIGLNAPMLALILLAIPSVLAGAYAGVEGAPAPVVDAARSMGFSEWEILTKVEAPLGLPLLVGGIRAAMLQVVATATLAAYVGAGGLGRYLFLGLKTQNYPMMLAASMLVVALAIVLELLFEVLVRATARNTKPVRQVAEA